MAHIYRIALTLVHLAIIPFLGTNSIYERLKVTSIVCAREII